MLCIGGTQLSRLDRKGDEPPCKRKQEERRVELPATRRMDHHVSVSLEEESSFNFEQKF